MFKKYKAFMKNEGAFAQPGAQALQDYINTYNQQIQTDRATQAVRAANELRVLEAEEAAQEAEARAVVAELEIRGSDTQSLASELTFESSVSGETVTPRRQRLFAKRVTPPTQPVPRVPEPGSLTCSICLKRCIVCSNPWQRTRSDLMVSKLADIDHLKPVPHGIALKFCDHVFCGACLAQAIYHSLNMAFDPATYGTELPSYAS
ncbi:hypothetical protein B0H14DRAFT_2900256, partial [Mycena olivaceomarginata]